MDVHIKTTVFAEQDKEKVIAALKTFILDQLFWDLNLSSLECIVVAEDFSEEVLRYQVEKNLTERGHTNNEDGVAVAKVLKCQQNGEIVQALFLSDWIVVDLFDPERTQRAAHLLHHELCHVHDNYNKHKIYSENGRSGEGIDPLTHILNVHADNVWAEYFANRMSGRTLNMDTDLDVPHMMHLIGKIKEDCEELIREYRYHGEIVKLFHGIQEKTSLLLAKAGNVLGYVHFLNREEITSIIEDGLRNTYFFNIWSKLSVSLNSLFIKYPNWNDVYDLKDLGKGILQLWNEFGIFPSVLEDDELYIDVPFR